MEERAYGFNRGPGKTHDLSLLLGESSASIMRVNRHRSGRWNRETTLQPSRDTLRAHDHLRRYR